MYLHNYIYLDDGGLELLNSEGGDIKGFKGVKGYLGPLAL